VPSTERFGERSAGLQSGRNDQSFGSRFANNSAIESWMSAMQTGFLR
jgi:hypothetical protein